LILWYPAIMIWPWLTLFLLIIWWSNELGYIYEFYDYLAALAKQIRIVLILFIYVRLAIISFESIPVRFWSPEPRLIDAARGMTTFPWGRTMYPKEVREWSLGGQPSLEDRENFSGWSLRLKPTTGPATTMRETFSLSRWRSCYIERSVISRVES
jgi:hypothetical protein